MKTKIKILLSGVILFSQITLINGQNCNGSSFQRVFGDGGDERAHAVQTTSDNGYVIIGETNSYGAGNKDLFVMKLDINGVTQWTKTYGSTSLDDGSSASIVQTMDGGYLIGGHTESFGAGSSYDGYFLKLDGLGNIQWEQRATGSSYESIRDLKELSNGDFILLGNASSIGTGAISTYAIRLSSTGVVLWSKAYGAPAQEQGYSVMELSNGDLILSSGTNSYGSGILDELLIRIDNMGNIIWSKYYGGGGTDILYSTKMLSDGNIIAVGVTDSYGAGGDEILLSKIDTGGNLIWTKTYGGINTDRGEDVEENKNGEIIIAGYTNSYGSGGYDKLLISVDNNGNINWSKTYGGTGDDEVDRWAKAMTIASDTGIVIVGGTKSFGFGDDEVYVIKTNSCGESYCNEQSVVLSTASQSPSFGIAPLTVTNGGTFSNTVSISSQINFNENLLCDSNLVSINKEIATKDIFTIYPNPFSNILSIYMPQKNKDVDIQIVDVTGKLVLDYNKQVKSGKVELYVQNLQTGVYFILLTTSDGYIQKEKLIKMNN